MRKIIKDFLVLFLLTFLIYPRPTCDWTHSGKRCFPIPTGPSTIMKYIIQISVGDTIVMDYFFLEVGTVTAITISTLIGFEVLKKKLPTQKHRGLTMLLIWISAAIIWSIPYFYYGYFIAPTGFIE